MPNAETSRKRSAAVVGIVLATVLVIILLLLRNCHQTVAVNKPQFDYFVAKASELGNDPDRIVAYVRDQVPTLEYRGDVKGALGALWNGAASPEEKVLLAGALLTAAKAQKQVGLDDVCPGRDKKLDGSAAIQLVILHRIDRANQPMETQVYAGPAGALVGDVHSVEMAVEGKTRITVRSGTLPAVEIPVPDGADGESLLFRWLVPTGSKPLELTTVRELWHRGNRAGASTAHAGDRHDFAVLPCAIAAYVREKEEVILKQRGREASVEAPAYLALLDFAKGSDEYLAGIEKQMHVVAQRSEPRVVIWSRYKDPQLPDGYGVALDARIDRVGFAGERIAAYRATQVRAFVESALIPHFVEQAAALPADSAFGVFSMFKSDAPATVAQRIAQIRDTLRSLEQDRSLESVATFAVQGEGPSSGSAKAKVEARWSVGGIDLRNASDAPKGANTPSPPDKPPTGPRASGNRSVEESAIAVEAMLLTADVTPRVSPEYLLDTQIARRPMSLVQPGARFVLQWLDDNVRTEEQVRLLRVDGGLEYQWRVQAGVLPVAGTREVDAQALNTATTHNPWYRAGTSVQPGVTSFVLSRKVYASIKDKKGISVQMLGALGSKSDVPTTRPVDFMDTLAPGERLTIEATVNGKPEKVNILQATMRGKPMAILDDPAYPVGMAQGIKSVVTAIRGRLVDGRNQPVVGARVAVYAKDQPTQIVAEGGPTAPDGQFLLSPPDQADSFGKVTLQVTFLDKVMQKVDADLTAPGLSIVTIKVNPPAAKLLYLGRNDQRQLDALKLPDEIKRNARRDLETGRLVVIPSQEVGDGISMHSAYYVCDPQTGDLAGVMATGLCGAATWDDVAPGESPATAADATQELPEAETAQGPSEPASMRSQTMLAAWHAAERAHKEDNDSKMLLTQTLRSMRGWAQATDIGGTFAEAADDALGERLATVLKSTTLATSGNAAKPAFQIGFASATHYLVQKMESSDGK